MAKNEKALVIVLCCVGLLGVAGIHRFYKKKIVSGIIWMVTFGLFGIGTIIDLILLITKNKMLFDK